MKKLFLNTINSCDWRSLRVKIWLTQTEGGHWLHPQSQITMFKLSEGPQIAWTYSICCHTLPCGMRNSLYSSHVGPYGACASPYSARLAIRYACLAVRYTYLAAEKLSDGAPENFPPVRLPWVRSLTSAFKLHLPSLTTTVHCLTQIPTENHTSMNSKSTRSNSYTDTNADHIRWIVTESAILRDVECHMKNLNLHFLG